MLGVGVSKQEARCVSEVFGVLPTEAIQKASFVKTVMS